MANNHEDLFDFSHLRRASPGNEGFVKAILESFQKNNPGDFEHLISTVSEANFKEILKAAHKVKGSCRIIGYDEGVKHFGSMEDRIHSGEKPEDLDEWLTEGKKVIAKANDAIEKWLAEFDAMSD